MDDALEPSSTADDPFQLPEVPFAAPVADAVGISPSQIDTPASDEVDIPMEFAPVTVSAQKEPELALDTMDMDHAAEDRVPAFDLPHVDDLSRVADEVRAINGTEPAAAAIGNPLERWASMTPPAPPRVEPTSPTERWARMRPASATPGPVEERTEATPAAPPTWWDETQQPAADGARRGRFALGGNAVQPGHQVVSGVTYRSEVVPPPSRWLLGPVAGPVPAGTLVLQVEGCVNCTPDDVEVLMDQGFAPTSEGFTLRLAATAAGSFAMSGTFVIH